MRDRADAPAAGVTTSAATTSGVAGLTEVALQTQIDTRRAEQAARAARKPALTIDTSPDGAPFAILATLPASHPIKRKAAKAARAAMDREVDVGLARREASAAQHTLGALRGQLQTMKDEACEQAAGMRGNCARAVTEQTAAARAWERREEDLAVARASAARVSVLEAEVAAATKTPVTDMSRPRLGRSPSSGVSRLPMPTLRRSPSPPGRSPGPECHNSRAYNVSPLPLNPTPSSPGTCELIPKADVPGGAACGPPPVQSGVREPPRPQRCECRPPSAPDEKSRPESELPQRPRRGSRPACPSWLAG